MNVAKRTGSNTSGSYRSTRKNFTAAFDKLPREVRDALNSANFPFAPQRLQTVLRRGASVGAPYAPFGDYATARRRAIAPARSLHVAFVDVVRRCDRG